MIVQTVATQEKLRSQLRRRIKRFRCDTDLVIVSSSLVRTHGFNQLEDSGFLGFIINANKTHS